MQNNICRAPLPFPPGGCLCFHSSQMTTESIPLSASELKHQYYDNHDNISKKKARKTPSNISRQSAPILQSSDSSQFQIPGSPTRLNKRRSQPVAKEQARRSQAMSNRNSRKNLNTGVNDLRVKAPTLDAAGHIEKFNIAMLPYNVSRLVSEPEDKSSPLRAAASPKSSKSSVTATPRSSPLAFKMGKNQNSKSFDASPTSYNFVDVDAAELQPKKSSNLFSMLMSKRTPAAKRSHLQRPSAAYIGVALEDNIAFTAVDVNGDKIVVPTILDQCWKEVRKRGNT